MTRSDGSIEVGVRPDRNARYRAIVSGAGRSRPRTVGVFPREGFRFGGLGADGRVAISVSLRGPRDVGFGGRAAYFYLGRLSVHRWSRLAAGRVHGGRGSGTVSFRVRPPRNASARDRIVVCLRGQSRLGLGSDRLSRACGSAHVRF